ncbi:MAG: histidine ammonia-lyase [Xanthomonadaceae bacterium]|nr:histidine ammonia-lyase [Xanthomonadaceae bacterium]
MPLFEFGKTKITVESVETASKGLYKFRLSSAARKKILRSRKFLEKELKSHDTIYGVNTGFGPLSQVRIKDDDLKELQVNLLRSHATGVGDDLPIEQARAMLFLRAVNLVQGFSGVRIELVEQIIKFLNLDIIPVIPAQGSVGASGDLAPLAHLGLPLMGEGEVIHKGVKYEAGDLLKKLKIAPLELQSKEGLALINGTQFMTAIGSLALIQAERLARYADQAGALSLEAIRGTVSAFEPEIQAVRPHPGQILVAKHMRELLTPGGRGSKISRSHENCGKVQDPYSFRCIPQVHGVVRDSLKWVRRIIETEIGAVTDNPLIFPAAGKILSGGNFHGQYVSTAMDVLSIAVCELGSMAEQRIEKLVNPTFSGLPAFLTKKGGLNSGMMIVQYAAASIVSENKTLAHPASVDSIPTSADKEDHVSMGAWSARKAMMIVSNVRRVIAMELLCACQGLDLIRPLKSSQPIEKIRKEIRKLVPFYAKDRSPSGDLKKLESWLA